MKTNNTTQTAEETRLTAMKTFYATLTSEIDLPYFADASHESFDDLREAIQDGNGFDVEIIYYSRAMEYLIENDTSLRRSLELASEMGYEPKNLSSEILASILASENSRSECEELETERTEFFDKLNEERDAAEETV